MCMPKAPKAPAPIPPRAAPRAPQMAALSTRTQELMDRRSSMASTVMTPLAGLGSAPTAGKALLGN